MQYLVTGGAGFIGSALCDRLVADGHDVSVLDDFSTGNPRRLDGIRDRIRLIEGDIRDRATVERAAAGADVVFHQAALPSVARSVQDPWTSNDVNVSGTLTVLEAARRSGDAGIEPKAQTTDAQVAQPEQQLEALPQKHRPRIDLTIKPKTGLKTGDLVHLQITAEAAAGNDITIPDNAFGAFEVYKKDVRIETLSKQRRKHIFTIDLIALEPGEQTLPEITLRVVTADGIVGGVQTKARKLKIESLLANEPDAKPKGPTQPVEVMQDDYILLYILGGILAAVLVALLTLVVALAVLAVAGARQAQRAPAGPLPLATLALLLAGYAASRRLVPPIVRAGLAAGVALFCLHVTLFRQQPPAALWGLAALALPILPSLHFMLDYPLRLASAALSCALCCWRTASWRLSSARSF